MQATNEEMWTLKEVMKYLRVSRSTVLRMMQSGQLLAHKVGYGWRFYRENVQACIVTPAQKGQTHE